MITSQEQLPTRAGSRRHDRPRGVPKWWPAALLLGLILTACSSAPPASPPPAAPPAAAPTTAAAPASTPAAAPAAVAAPTGKITIALATEPTSLDNWAAYSVVGHPVIRNVQEALLNRDPKTNELVGELATSWEAISPTTWRFKLRQGVKYHNGDPFNADAAAFGLNYTWSKENNFLIRAFVGPEMEAKAVDEYTLDVTTEAPDPILPSRLYFAPLPNKRQVQEHPETLPLEPIGTGPYKFVEWNKGQYIRLTANPEWWGNANPEDAHGTITYKDVEYTFRKEPVVRSGMVRTGEAQLAQKLTADVCNTDPVCKMVPTIETIFLRLDTPNPVLKDHRVREAIAHALDIKTVGDKFYGTTLLASQMVGPSAVGYNQDLKPYAYDLDQAKKLVADAKTAGVPTDRELTVVGRVGAFPRVDDLAQYITNQLNQIGLKARTEMREKAQLDAGVATSYRDVPEDRGWILLYSHGNELMDVGLTAGRYYKCTGASSTMCDPELDKMIDAALSASGSDRAQKLQAIQKKVYDDVLVVPLLHQQDGYGLADNLDWQPRLDGFMLVKEMAPKH